MSLVARVRAFASRHALWQPSTRVVAAVSGGSDSVAMLWLLRDLALAGELRLEAIAHLNHGTRGGDSDGDEAFCRDLAARLAVPFECRRVDVPAVARESRQSIEVAARQERQRFFRELLEARGADVVATAHTLDDQAETVLLRLLRGAGARGMSGIRARRAHLVRPLLGCRRAELQATLVERDESWREDATNADLANPRNRVRHELLPYLRTHFNPAVADALARLADVAGTEDAWLTELAETASRQLIRCEGGTVELDGRALVELPEALARRVVRQALMVVAPRRAFSLEDVDLVRAVASGARSAAEILSVRVERFRNSAVLIQRATAARPRRRGLGISATRRR